MSKIKTGHLFYGINKISKLGIVMSLLCGFYSCSNKDDGAIFEEKERKSMYNEDNISEFVKLEGNYLTHLTANVKNDRSARGGLNIGVFRVHIGRASRGCLRGLGFCNFRWFPDFRRAASPEVEVKEKVKGEGYGKPKPKLELEKTINRSIRTISDTKSRNEKLLILKHDNKGDFMEILVGATIPANTPTNLLDLVVDKDLIIKVENKEIKIVKGHYPYNQNIGAFGGYKIYLKGF